MAQDERRWVRLHAVAAAQHGLVRRGQAEALGFAPSSITAMASRGEWLRVQPGVYAVAGVRPTARQRLVATLLRCPDAVATGWTAAWLWHLVSAAPSVADLVIRADAGRGPTSSRARVRRSTTLTDDDVTPLDGIRVVTVARMLVDLAADAQVEALRALAIDARQRRLLDVGDLAAAVVRAGRTAGVGRLRQLVGELDAERADSVLEHRLRRLLEAAGLHPHPSPWPVTIDGVTIHLDIAFPAQRVAVEVEGFGFHSTRAQLSVDQRRANLLQHSDWRVLRVGWDDVERRPDVVVGELARLLRSRGWRPEGQPVRCSR